MASSLADTGKKLNPKKLISREGGQLSAPAPGTPFPGAPLRRAKQPPPPEIPYMDRPIVDPSRHAPLPFTSKHGIPREDLRVSLRAMPGHDNPNDPPAHDDFFDSEKVLMLNHHNFGTFLKKTDVTLVLFYEESNPRTDMLLDVFSEAADNTKRANHAFAGVDCYDNRLLCKANKVCKLPSVRIYSRDYCLGEVKDQFSFTAEAARQLVEQAPLVDRNSMANVR